MRFLTVLLLTLILVVQVELWLGRSGLPRVYSLSSDLSAQRTQNDALRASNERLAAEVADLKTGLEMVEERARTELNMIRPKETLVAATTPPAR